MRSFDDMPPSNALDFLVNGLERRIGLDLNGDDYIGGEDTFEFFIDNSLVLSLAN